MCASNSAHSALPDKNSKGVKYNQAWNSRCHNCRNRLHLCANVLSITSFRALQVCAWNVAHPGLSDRTNKGVKVTQPWNSAAQPPEQFAQMFFRIREQSSTYIWRTPSGWKVHNYLYSFLVILP